MTRETEIVIARKVDETRDLLGTRTRVVSLGPASRVARTKSVLTYPTTPNRYYACECVTILGPEVEGGSGTVEPSGDCAVAFNVGSRVPPIDTLVILSFIDHRWVFRYD